MSMSEWSSGSTYEKSMATTALEQFEYIRNIGKGSYGEVTLARHKRDRKQVILYTIYRSCTFMVWP